MALCKLSLWLLLVLVCLCYAVDGHDVIWGRSLTAADEKESTDSKDSADQWGRNRGNDRWAGLGRNQPAAATEQQPQPWLQQPTQPARGAGQSWLTRGNAQNGGGYSQNGASNDNGQGGNRGGRQNPGQGSGWSSWLGGGSNRQQTPNPTPTPAPAPAPAPIVVDNQAGGNRGGNRQNGNGWNGWGSAPGGLGRQGRSDNDNRNDNNDNRNNNPGRNNPGRNNPVIIAPTQSPRITPGVMPNPGRGAGGALGQNQPGRWGQNQPGPNGPGAVGGVGGRGPNRPRPSLSPLLGETQQFGRISARPIQVSGEASTLAQGIRRRGNSRAAAESLARAYTAGRGDAAAEAVASASASGGDAAAVGEAVAETAYRQPRAAPWLLRRSADLAVNSGNTQGFARSMSNAFVFARKNRYMPQFTTAVADAISTGGAPTRYAYGQAIATAIAEGGEGQAAVAEATASAFCTGGSTATAWASAYAVALNQDSRGCLVLSQARALARARCGDGVAQTFTRAQATSVVLGFCGLGDLGIDMGWSGSNADSSSTGNGYADANGLGSTGGYPYGVNQEGGYNGYNSYNGFNSYNGGYGSNGIFGRK